MQPVPDTFADFLKQSGGPTEVEILADKINGRSRRDQLMSFWEEAKLVAASLPAAKDKNGKEIKVNDTVTLTLKVTGIHMKPGDLDRDVPDKVILNLARTNGQGIDLHLLTLEAERVEKK
jgi:hypothetical protein